MTAAKYGNDPIGVNILNAGGMFFDLLAETLTRSAMLADEHDCGRR